MDQTPPALSIRFNIVNESPSLSTAGLEQAIRPTDCSKCGVTNGRPLSSPSINKGLGLIIAIHLSSLLLVYTFWVDQGFLNEPHT